MKHIHVAGTKGKGSVCAYATSMLRQYTTVGTYTSPHLVSPRERIAINGKPIDQATFATAFFELWDLFTAAAVQEGKGDEYAESHVSKPFFFRFLTILAWHVFLKQGIKSVVMECGIGGEYDATNILPPQALSAAVISHLGIDHVAMLGDTVEKIAWHKAGILKPGCKGFTMNKSQSLRVLQSRALEKGADLTVINDELVQQWGGVKGTLQGDFQRGNQALAALAVQAHLDKDTNPYTALMHLEQPMIQGLQEATIRGRCEVVQQDESTWLLDGAHTKESLEQVAQWAVPLLRDNPVLIFNQQERNAAQLLESFLAAVKTRAGRDVFTHAIFTRNDLEAVPEADTSVQSAAAKAMADISPDCQVQIFDNVVAAVDEARRLSDNVVVTGSLHLVGGALRTLEPEIEL